MSQQNTPLILFDASPPFSGVTLPIQRILRSEKHNASYLMDIVLKVKIDGKSAVVDWSQEVRSQSEMLHGVAMEASG